MWAKQKLHNKLQLFTELFIQGLGLITTIQIVKTHLHHLLIVQLFMLYLIILFLLFLTLEYSCSLNVKLQCKTDCQFN